MGSFLSSLGQSTGATQLGTAAANTLSGGAYGEDQYLNSLGQSVPQGVDLLPPIGPTEGASANGSGPGFFHGLAQGFTGILGQYQHPDTGTQWGQGLGMLANFIDQSRGGGRPMAGNLLRSALASYGVGSEPASRIATPMLGPAMARNEVDPQGGLLHLDLGQAIKSYLSGGLGGGV